MTKLLFITWDGPQTSYMEGLFMPILSAVQQKSDVQVHVIQFTWANSERIAITQKKATELNIIYSARPIIRKPIAIIGSIISIYKGIRFLKKYIEENKIDVLMPRSTMPAVMINRIKKKDVKLIFDADGLPLEERVDFSGLSRNSKQYQFFKQEEYKILVNADAVMTRSRKAIEIHSKTINSSNSDKFSVVLNGRDSNSFKMNSLDRNQVRNELAITEKTKVFVYCGSLGPQYGWDEMISIFDTYQMKHEQSLFLILTGNLEFAENRIPTAISNKIKVIKVPFEEVPKYLSAADVAFAIREPKFSMQGVAPIKLGEYLLMGLPTIASVGIGDSEEIIESIPNCFLFRHEKDSIQKAISFVENSSDVDHNTIRAFGIQYFSIEKSVESYLESLKKII